MSERWETYACQMGEHRAFITFDAGYAETGRGDGRPFLLKIRVPFRLPNAQGLPTQAEFEELSDLDDALAKAVEARGGVYVGRITVDRHRYFHYFVAIDQAAGEALVDEVAPQTRYRLASLHSRDEEKKGYFQDLYPTPDDWQVIRDMKVLDELRKQGDPAEAVRPVRHWADFPEAAAAEAFAAWARGQGYTVEPPDPASPLEVRFGHEGSMVLDDVTRHTIRIGRKVRELGGTYDGWETSVER